jgi:hypothetical protein
MRRGDRLDGLGAPRRQELAHVLRGLVSQFGYTVVKNELLAVKRAEATREEQVPTAAGKVNDDFQRSTWVWLLVECERRSVSPPITAKKACERIAMAGGVTEFDGGGFGISPAARWHTANKETIYREYKRARRLAREHPGAEEFWERALTPFVRAAVPLSSKAPKAAPSGPAKGKVGKK